MGGQGEHSSATTCVTAAVMQLSGSRAYPPFFCSFARVFVIVGRSSRGRKVGFAAAMITSEAPPPEYDVLWSVGVGAALAPVACR